MRLKESLDVISNYLNIHIKASAELLVAYARRNSKEPQRWSSSCAFRGLPTHHFMYNDLFVIASVLVECGVYFFHTAALYSGLLQIYIGTW